MKKWTIFVVFAGVLAFFPVFAQEDAAVTPPASDAVVMTPATESPAPAEAAPVSAPAEEVTPPAEEAPAVVPPAETAVTAPAVAENLEFVSGEVSSTDEAAKTITVKLYGEAEEGTQDKTVTIRVDENTDITDGENDKDMKSLTAGTEVDVEYDTVTNTATYVFVY